MSFVISYLLAIALAFGHFTTAQSSITSTTSATTKSGVTPSCTEHAGTSADQPNCGLEGLINYEKDGQSINSLYRPAWEPEYADMTFDKCFDLCQQYSCNSAGQTNCCQSFAYNAEDEGCLIYTYTIYQMPFCLDSEDSQYLYYDQTCARPSS